ncbi:MAG: rhodanese-like domain-containing protein [Chloroflexi bacterium]|nr:rhodanese-like domain-containing protein [Chloroflexota bacterium]
MAGIALANQSSFQSIPGEISIDEAYRKYQEGAFVLDVRTQEEWAEYHATNTTLIPLDELPSRLDEVPRDQEIVVICRSGNRSQVGRDILLEAGFEDVTSAAGGLKAWSAAGYPIEGTRP